MSSRPFVLPFTCPTLPSAIRPLTSRWAQRSSARYRDIVHSSGHYNLNELLGAQALSVDARAEKVIVTCKKTLVGSDLPVITSYEEAQPGMQSHGFISSIKVGSRAQFLCLMVLNSQLRFLTKDYGVFVTFFNGVTGLVGLTQLSNSFIARPETVFSVGQVVKCRVLTSDPEKKRITLSFLVNVPHSLLSFLMH